MPQFSVEQALQMAVQHQAAGRLAEAAALCSQVLGAVPNSACTDASKASEIDDTIRL